jgi:RimJ/RimL family protein N-acetyltransferase
MSISPPSLDDRVRNGPYYLTPFDNAMAPVVASWAPSGRTLFWLAPNTPPPLTPAKVVNWQGPGGSPFMLCRDGMGLPLGYFELNPMPGRDRSSWLGHCILAPDRRRTGLGRAMVEMMLEEAFVNARTRDVWLVAFPENRPAIQCYRRAGFVEAGSQLKHFQTTGQSHLMLRMMIDQKRYHRLRRNRRRS